MIPLDIYPFSSRTIHITFDINHQSINPLASINHLTSINHQSTFGINDNMIQQSPPLALMEIPTLMSTPIIDVNM
jgi:hypothetical protein